MKPFTFYRSKKYFQRVMLSIMLAMALILTGLSVVNTYVLESSVKKVQENSNLKVLTQIQYNLSYMNEIMTHLSTFAYNDNFLIPLMFSRPLPQMDYIRGYREMANIMKSSSFLHSMAVYNASSGELYGSTGEFLVDGGVTKARMLNWLLHPPQPHPTLRLIPVSLEQEDGKIDAFAFIVTDAFTPYTKNRSALILYIKSDWVFDSLRKMNDTDNQAQGQIYIQTPDGRLFSSEGLITDSLDQAAIAELLSRDKAASGRTSGAVTGSTGREKSIITYMEGIGDWTILYVQPYKLLMKEVTDTRTKSVLISGVFLLLSMGVSIWLSYKLYGPIENMLRLVRPRETAELPAGRSDGNELEQMGEHYVQMSEKLQEISSEQIVSKYYVRKFLTDSHSSSQQEMQFLIDKHELHIAGAGPLLVCVLRIDKYTAYDQGTPVPSKKLYSFAIVNIAQEIISGAYTCEAVDLQGDHFVLIVSAAGGNNAEFAGVKPLARKIQDTIEQYYGISLSCGISSPITQLPSLSAAYHQAYQLSLYTFVAGYKSIVLPEDVRENQTNKRKTLPPDIERKLSEALKKGQLTTAGSELEKAFSLLATFPYEEMRRVLADLAWVIQNAAAEIVNNRVISLAVDMDQIHKIPQEHETLDEIYVALLSLCAKICEGQRPANMERNELIIGTVKELIEQKFADLNLSQQSIASTVKLTSAYVGKLFKDNCGVSVTEYINDVRLRHAQELLLQSDYTITEIMERCGYANQSHFFRLFKGKFGTTPKEYRIKKLLS